MNMFTGYPEDRIEQLEELLQSKDKEIELLYEQLTTAETTLKVLKQQLIGILKQE